MIYDGSVRNLIEKTDTIARFVKFDRADNFDKNEKTHQTEEMTEHRALQANIGSFEHLHCSLSGFASMFSSTIEAYRLLITAIVDYFWKIYYDGADP